MQQGFGFYHHRCRYPVAGRFAGGRGCLAVGEMADLILFDWEQGATSLDIRETYVAGQKFVAE